MAQQGFDVRSEDRRLDSLRIHVSHAGRTSHAGVLLYPTIMGLDDTMRAFAKSFASKGLTAVVWDPYDGEDGTGNVKEMFAKSKRREDKSVVRDLKLIVDYMKSALDLTSIAGVGWCFGGRIAILHGGSDDRIEALSSYNPTIWSPTPVSIEGMPVPVSRSVFQGQTMDEFALAAAVRGPVQVCRPEHDFTQPAEYQRLIDALHTRHDPTFYEYYPGSGHGFSYTPGRANESAHRFAWAATLSLLSARLLGQ